jgi:hypothetical protein
VGLRNSDTGCVDKRKYLTETIPLKVCSNVSCLSSRYTVTVVCNTSVFLKVITLSLLLPLQPSVLLPAFRWNVYVTRIVRPYVRSCSTHSTNKSVAAKIGVRWHRWAIFCHRKKISVQQKPLQGNFATGVPITGDLFFIIFYSRITPDVVVAAPVNVAVTPAPPNVAVVSPRPQLQFSLHLML